MIRHSQIFSGVFSFEDGEQINDLELVYHTSHVSHKGRPVVWICHALTANSNPEEWWSELVGSGKLFDTDTHYIICSNMIGSSYGTSSPSSINPQTSRPYLLDFPRVSVRDIVCSMELLRKELGIDSIDVLVGGSIGGFQALEWSMILGERLRNLVLIATNARVTAWGSAFNESQRMAIESDETFLAQHSIEGGKKGLECARSIALLSYRSFEAYNATQYEANEDTLFASRALSYQRYQGRKLSNRFDAYCYYRLTQAVDSHNIGRGRGTVERALSAISTPTVVIGITSDVLFPISQQQFLAKYIPNSKYFEIESDYGHDGFLLEYEQISHIISTQCKY